MITSGDSKYAEEDRDEENGGGGFKQVAMINCNAKKYKAVIIKF